MWKKRRIWFYRREKPTENKTEPPPFVSRPLAAILPFFLLTTTQISCVSPTTPFGAVDIWEIDSNKEGENLSVKANDKNDSQLTKNDNEGENDLQIKFYPSHQYLTSPKDWRVEISHPFFDISKGQLRVQYGGVDVTDEFNRWSNLSINDRGKKIIYRFPYLNLPPKPGVSIDVSFQVTPFGHVNVYKIDKRFEMPRCEWNDFKSVLNQLEFDNAGEFIDPIHQTALLEQVNPNLLFGLIAQESSFNVKALSHAKAMGLTQITHLAAHEVSKNRPWPKYRGIEELSYPSLKTMILFKKINKKNEWRLHPEYSIRGGAIYLKDLAKYWRRPKSLSFLYRNGFKQVDTVTELVLASYNSGVKRVRQSILDHGKSWIFSHELNEARKYISKVMSYCHHSSIKELKISEAQ